MSTTKPKLGLLIITKNEEKNLPACLESVRGLVDEMVLVDNHSQDRTLEIARSFTDKIFQRPLTGYAEQKQFGLEQCRSEWILNLDADERLSPELRQEIQACLQNSRIRENGYSVPFEVHFMGKALRFGRPGRERHVRLFRRSLARYAGLRVHEKVAIPDPVGFLRHPIVHRPYPGFQIYLEKLNRYTTMAAQEKYEFGERFSWRHHGLLPWKFFQEYVLERGCLDGVAGLVWSALSAYYHWMKYLKLREMQSGEGT